MISIVNYGMGNLGSIINMLKKIGQDSKLVSMPSEIRSSERIILPGVGSFDNAMRLLRDLHLTEPIREAATKGIPILGICLGMQLLGTKSEEGELSGLDLIPGKIIRFPQLDGLKIPHMGWNQVKFYDERLISGLETNRFYFVHSYYFDVQQPADMAGETVYGITFPSVIRKNNITGFQFHPEKSHKYGMQLLRNFVAC
ncbi:MAG TPA: imidazole glycerol phosphate synthase subunit HisH [Desulfobacteraceae bacterium]|nr:imidazole glycerol phosphate synthase subunit HisH [Desulfobacteraceae bacterium]HPQ27831.1 imidazole glycerol phosphate synthase subunit HisH [Desulfobacteraceae bacterium]